MNRDMHLSLIGFMGSGKSTFGQAMATRLGRPFLDTDAEVERMLGMPIPQVFEELGERRVPKGDVRRLLRQLADHLRQHRQRLVDRRPLLLT